MQNNKIILLWPTIKIITMLKKYKNKRYLPVRLGKLKKSQLTTSFYWFSYAIKFCTVTHIFRHLPGRLLTPNSAAPKPCPPPGCGAMWQIFFFCQLSRWMRVIFGLIYARWPPLQAAHSHPPAARSTHGHPAPPRLLPRLATSDLLRELQALLGLCVCVCVCAIPAGCWSFFYRPKC